MEFTRPKRVLTRALVRAWANRVGSSASMCVELQTRRGLGQHRRERRLARLERFSPQVVAVQLNQVEGVEEDSVVMAAVADPIERRDAVVVAGTPPRRR